MQKTQSRFRSHMLELPAIILYLGIICLVSLFIPVIGYITFIVAAAFLLTQHKNYSVIEGLTLAVLLFSASIITLYSFITIFKLHLSVEHAPGLLLLAVFPYLVRQLRSRNQLAFKLRITHEGDITALIVSLATFITLLVPVAHLTGPKIAQFLSYGEDNASHYALSQYIYQHGTFAYNKSPQDDGLLRSLEIYPQGFHVAAATFAGTYPHRATAASFLRLYMLFITFDYALFIFWFAKLCSRMANGRSAIVLEFALLAPITFLCGLGIFLLLLDRGFQPQIFAYSFLAAIVFVLDNATIRGKQGLQPALIVLALTIGVASSWWPLLPIIAAVLVQYIWCNGLTRPLFQKLLRFTPLLLAIGFAILYPVLVSIMLNKKSDPLDEPGGVDPLHGYIFWYLLPVVLLAAPRMLRTIKKFSYTYVSLLISLGLLGAIALYQLITIGRLEYYFYKSVYTILLISIVIFFLAAHEVLGYLYRALGKAKLVVPIVTIGLFFIIANQTNLVYVKVYIHNWFPNAVQPTDLAILFTPQATTYSHIAFVGSCNAGRNYLADRWSGARLESESPHFSALEGATIKNQPKEMSAQLRSLAKSDKKLLIVQYPGCTQEIPNLTQIESRPNVTTISRP